MGVRERIRVPWPAARMTTVGAVTGASYARASWGAGIRTPTRRLQRPSCCRYTTPQGAQIPQAAYEAATSPSAAVLGRLVVLGRALVVGLAVGAAAGLLGRERVLHRRAALPVLGALDQQLLGLLEALGLTAAGLLDGPPAPRDASPASRSCAGCTRWRAARTSEHCVSSPAGSRRGSRRAAASRAPRRAPAARAGRARAHARRAALGEPPLVADHRERQAALERPRAKSGSKRARQQLDQLWVGCASPTRNGRASWPEPTTTPIPSREVGERRLRVRGGQGGHVGRDEDRPARRARRARSAPRRAWSPRTRGPARRRPPSAARSPAARGAGAERRPARPRRRGRGRALRRARRAARRRAAAALASSPRVAQSQLICAPTGSSGPSAIRSAAPASVVAKRPELSPIRRTSSATGVGSSATPFA